MKLAILETGAPPEGLEVTFGTYPDMFRALLGTETATSFNVMAGELPDRPEDFAAYVITGSSAGVYEDHPWIEPLKAFLVSARGKAALVGVCFGHQIMAEAFGGQVVKSSKGWCVGLHGYEVQALEPWMDSDRPIHVAASHQDQVIKAPPGARVIASSAFTPFGMLAYDDQPAISIQLHPEFDPAYAKALIEARRGSRYTDVQADTAIASYAGDNDAARVGQWIKAFLAQAVPET